MSLKRFQLTCCIVGLSVTTILQASEQHASKKNGNAPVTKESESLHVSQEQQKKSASPSSPRAQQQQMQNSAQSTASAKKSYKSFTGKVIGNVVRLRASADVESTIIAELHKGDMVVVVGEKYDFYAVAPLPSTKAYVFRSFVLDGTVEGNRVNVRQAPDLSAPIIGHLNTGDKIDGKISESNNKWLEIDPPSNTVFYVAKEFIEYLGGPELKGVRDAKTAQLSKHVEASEKFYQLEMKKPFNEIDFDHVCHNFELITSEFTEFPEAVQKAKQRLVEIKEIYLQKKLAYLEARTQQMSKELSTRGTTSAADTSVPATPVEEVNIAFDRMKVWEPVEHAVFQTWAASQHYSKSIDEFYQDQKANAKTISGIVEPYTDQINGKPGDYIIRERDLPKAYVYSTHINLQPLVGKYVQLSVAKRDNHGFAFPAYFVLEVQ